MIQTILFALLTAALWLLTYAMTQIMDSEKFRKWSDRASLRLDMAVRIVGCLIFVASFIFGIAALLVALHILAPALATFGYVGIFMLVLLVIGFLLMPM